MNSLNRGGTSAPSIGRGDDERFDKKCFFLVCEGAKTEHGYFDGLMRSIEENATTKVSVKITKTRHKSSPKDLLVVMKRCLKEYEASIGKDIGEAWIVLDRDNWPIPQLEAIYKWAETKSNYNVAISDPQFEYWLILHYKCGTKERAKNKRTCESYLREHGIKKYKKGKPLPQSVFDPNLRNEAIVRARVRDASKCKKWPSFSGCTTVYRLVENILKLSYSG